MKCAECKFWVAEDGKAPVVGECHRRAPMPVSSQGLSWPVTLDETFCGEFVAKAEKRVEFV
jgi:hypothetical protein